MNKSYISVWNDESGTWVAAPETARKSSGKGTLSSSVTLSGNVAMSRPAIPLKAAFMPIAMALGAVMLPGGANAAAKPGAGGLELCSAPIGNATTIGSSWGSSGSAVGGVYCAPDDGGKSVSFSLNNTSNPVGAEGYDSGAISARVTGYATGELVLQGMGGISMVGGVNMSGYKVGNVGAGTVAADSGDAVNGGQLYEYTRYFKANSSSADASSDASATGVNAIAEGAFSKATGTNSVALGANSRALVSNSVALGADSVANRSDTVSVGYTTQDAQYTRQITNVSQGSAGTDAVNVEQLNAAISAITGEIGNLPAANPVGYDTATKERITLAGKAGTEITNLKAGDISSETSMDAVNGGQLFQTNETVAGVSDKVTNMAGDLDGVKNQVNNLLTDGLAASPLVVAYDSLARDHVTLGGADGGKPVGLSNVADGKIAAASTDAVTGNQLFETNSNIEAVQDNLTYALGQFIGRGANYFSANSDELDSSATGKETVAMGGGSVASADNSVAVGSKSVADRANTVSVGAKGSERQIVNVKAGDISTVNSTDAVTGGQLYTTNANVTNLRSDFEGTVADFFTQGINYFAANSNQDSASATGADSVAMGGLAKATANNSVAIGSNSVADREDAVSVGAVGAERQITNVAGATQDTDAVNLAQLKKAIANVETGPGDGSGVANPVAYDSDARNSLTLGDVGAAPVALRNVAKGKVSSNSTDAVNGAQLYNTANSTAKALGGGSTVASDGTVTAPGYSVAGSTYSNVEDALNAVSDAAGVETGAAKYVKVKSTAASALASGTESVAIGGAALASANNSVALGYGAKADRANTVSVGASGAERQIVNVAAGDISSETSTDAVNGAQLHATNTNLASLEDTVGYAMDQFFQQGINYFAANSDLDPSKAAGAESVAMGGGALATANNSVAIGSASLADRNNTVSVGAVGAERQITNVAGGTELTDAVNVAQLNAAIATVGGPGGPGSADAVQYDTTAHDVLTLGGTAGPPVALRNVAPGTVAAGSLDAVNGGQLHDTADSIAKALGGNSTVNPDGTVSSPEYRVSGVTYDNMGDALSALNGAAGDLVGAAKYVKVVSEMSSALATGEDSVAIGGGAMATNTGALAIGTGATATFANSTAIGVNAITDAENTVSFGSRSKTARLTHVANGIDPTDAATVAQLNALESSLTDSLQPSGVKSMLSGGQGAVTNYIAVSNNVTGGSNTSASDDLNAMAIGPVAAATGVSALAVGARSAAGSDFSTAVGSGAGALSKNATAIGASATVASGSDNSVSIGYNTHAMALNTLAMGPYTEATGAGSVAIGYYAFTDRAATNGLALGSNTMVTAANGVAIGYGAVADRANAVSVGNTTRQSQIINVAAGTNATDAVNVTQLTNLANVIGGGATVNPDGTIKAPSFKVGGKTYSDVGAAIAATASDGAASAVQYDDAEHTKLTLGGADASAPVELKNVANGVADNDAVNMSQLKKLGMDVDGDGQVTNSFVAYDDTSLDAITLKGTNGTKISNLANGDISASSRDAVTGAQLFSTNADVADVAANLANITNTVNNITVVGAGIKYFHVNSTLDDSTATGTNAVAVGAAASATANNSVALGSNSVADRADAVSVGAVGAERQIVNVANGTKGTDAVNLSQLRALGANIDGDGAVTNSFVAYDNPAKTALTLGGVGSETPVLLTNLQQGNVAASSRDAVTGGQLYGTANSIADALGTTVQGDGTLKAPTYNVGGAEYNTVGSALDAVSGQLGQINTNFSTNLKYIKVVSESASAQASGGESIAIGGNAMATNDNSLAIGSGATSAYANSTAIGVNAITEGENTVSFGSRNHEARLTRVANGIDPTDAVTMAQLTALQTQLTDSQSSGVKSMMQTGSSVTNYIAVSSNVTGGSNTSASDDMNAMAIGPMASAGGVSALAVGARAISAADNATAVGAGAGALSKNSTAIGASATVGIKSDNSVSIGYNSRSIALNALALGTSTVVSGVGSVAIGYAAFVDEPGTNGLALGSNTTVSSVNGVAIGYGAVADRDNAVSVGSKARQSQIINVAAGVENTDAVNVAQLNAAISSVGNGGSADAVVYDSAAHDVLTLNNTGAATKIRNVAAGTLSATSSEAVNGSQLYNTATSVASALGGGATVDADGKVSKPTYTLNGATYNSVEAALVAAAAAPGGGGASPDAVNYDTPEHDKLTLGNTGKPVTLSNVAAGVANNDAVNVAQLKAMGATLDGSGKVSNAFVAYDDSTKGTVTFGGASSPAVTLANVAAGQVTSGSKQAINGSQLYNAMNSTAAALGGGSKVGTDGQVTAPTYSLDGKSFTGVESALGALNAKIDTGGNLNGVAYDSETHDKLTLGNEGTPVTIANVADATADDEAVNLKQLKEAGLSTDKDGNTLQFATYDDAGRTSLTFGKDDGLTILKHVGAGVDDTDAVNVGQMKDYVTEYVSKNGGSGGNGGNTGTANAVAYDDDTKTHVTLGGADAVGPVTLSNLADGKEASDAVTYGQFSSLQNQLNNLSTGDIGGGNTYINIGSPGDSDTGTAAVASGTDAIALGNGAKANGLESIAIGKNALTDGDSSIAMGSGASAADANSLALGSASSTKGANSVALGSGASTQSANSVALGSGASAQHANSVALGADSTTDRDNSVSVGSADLQRQLTNVAAGTSPTDAVNVGQLQQSMGNISSQINNVDRNAAKGIASASALNIVTPYLPGRTTLNAGIANYRGFQAVGLGVSRWNEKGTINYNLGVSSSGGNSTIVRAGVGIVLGN